MFKKISILLCLGWLLALQGQAMAQDPVPTDVDLLDVRFMEAQGETVNLVLKSGSRKFKLVCDNVNNLASMLKGLGFPDGYKPKEIKTTSTINQVRDELAKTQPIYCKSYVPRGTENPLSYAIGYYGSDTYLWYQTPVNGEQTVFLYKVTNCQGTLNSFTYATNSPNGSNPALDVISTPKYDNAVRVDEDLHDLEIKCFKGKPIEEQKGPVFAATSFEQTIIAGRSIEPIVLSASDVNHDEVETFMESSSCNWLKYDAASGTVTGDSYPSTLLYSCDMQVNALANKALAAIPVHVKVNVQPLVISKLVAGYRRNCATFNDGKVSCWGLSMGTPADKMQKHIELFEGNSELALTKSSAPNSQRLGAIKDNELFSVDTKFANRLEDYQPILPGGTLQDLRAGMDMFCHSNDTKDTICYGPNIRFYNVPSTPEKYTSFDMNFSLFCGQKEGETNVACRGTTLSFPAADVKKYSSSKDSFCVLKNDGTVDCQTRRATDPIKTALPAFTGVKDLALAFDYACALKDGKADCWPKTLDGALVPAEANSLAGVLGVVTGFDHTCLQQANMQNVYCWGGNLFNNIDVSRPMDIVKLRKDLDLWETMPLDSF